MWWRLKLFPAFSAANLSVVRGKIDQWEWFRGGSKRDNGLARKHRMLPRPIFIPKQPEAASEFPHSLIFPARLVPDPARVQSGCIPPPLFPSVVMSASEHLEATRANASRRRGSRHGIQLVAITFCGPLPFLYSRPRSSVTDTCIQYQRLPYSLTPNIEHASLHSSPGLRRAASSHYAPVGEKGECSASGEQCCG